MRYYLHLDFSNFISLMNQCLQHLVSLLLEANYYVLREFLWRSFSHVVALKFVIIRYIL